MAISHDSFFFAAASIVIMNTNIRTQKIRDIPIWGRDKERKEKNTSLENDTILTNHIFQDMNEKKICYTYLLTIMKYAH